MCKSIDAAIVMVNRSIELAKSEDDRRYFMDYVKLHKLLYIAQGRAFSYYGTALFEDEIEAHRCGPLVRGLDIIPGKCGFDLITKRLDPAEFGSIAFPLSFSRKKAIEDVLQEFGTFSTEGIVFEIKEAVAFKQSFTNCEMHDSIKLPAIGQAAIELFEKSETRRSTTK